ncbi:hypothetical protein [Castellaniella sp.]|uniref:hypothetical protein n=1 Tax=Castellaniella sp. TaxID=1955812 RepID=UPI003C744A09
MDGSSNVQIVDGSINLPVDKIKLGNFISGLLGQPQVLDRRFDTPFSVDHDWLIHLCSMILQRIAQQNSAEPLTFETTIYYRDGLFRKVSGFDAFTHFSETQQVVCVGIKFDISMLISFPGKDNPERQQLEMTLLTNEEEEFTGNLLLGERIRAGLFYIDIRHTERTWADDILNLITKEFQSVQRPEPILKKKLRRLFLPFASLLFPFSALGGLVLESWSRSSEKDVLNASVSHLLSNNELNLPLLNDKIDTLLQIVALNMNRPGLGSALLFLAPLVIGVIVFTLGRALAQPTPSFILITKSSEVHKKAVEAKQSRRMMWLFGSMILSVALGVFGNYLYDLIK